MSAGYLLILDPDPLLTETLADLLGGEGFAVCRPGQDASALGPLLLVVGGDHDPALTVPQLPLSRPVRPGPLLAQIRETLDRAQPWPAIGPWRLDRAGRCLCGDGGARLRLTDKETLILSHLAESPAPLERTYLLAAIWGYGQGISTHTLETHVYRLRQKLEKAGTPDLLLTVDGGYVLRRQSDLTQNKCY